ncbi:CLUMA_CG003478, isoform A [Clunio marinus]|uniref:CLUMA_CG003478, isoform A n=1 Tax=Clunio marinus TaxID=568069 RepID=A0A1J1HP43_9DIPT|nr:CLUMA_CG003478, isoform A [Clunio marinus]
MSVNDSLKKNDRTVVIDDTMLLLLRKKRRSFYHQTCLLSVMAAFTIGLAMGIFFLPLIGLTSAKSPTDTISHSLQQSQNDSLHTQQQQQQQQQQKQSNVILSRVGDLYSKVHKYDFKSASANRNHKIKNQIHELKRNGNSFTPTTINNNFLNPTIYSSVSFISDEKYSTENILNSWNNGKARKVNNDYGIEVDDDDDVAIEIPDEDVDDDDEDDDMEGGMNSNNSQLNKNMNNDFDDLEHDNVVAAVDLLQQNKRQFDNVDSTSLNSYEKENNETLRRIVDDDFYWGQIVENRLPVGFSKRETENWRNYLESNTTEIVKIEQGCGRMQNRLVTFSDGFKACVRYRQNTDQIQGELFSFYLGRILNITNLAPSTAAVIDWDSRLWSQVREHITESQWKTSRPIVLTKWIADLEPSGIPEQFRPLERHLNREDIRNITLDDGVTKPTQILIDRLKPKYNADSNQNTKKLWQKKKIVLNDRMFAKFVELAQWSDLIIFDYLIANLDRVVNNLYNFQWNADIMAAPAHNLAKQINSQLLVFLDNESGLLHGYRLLKKYEAYHGLLLDNLCVFRKSTIDSLKYLRDNSPGELLNNLFERTTSKKVRDVLPPLPEKSVKILIDRIDRILQQVQKCQENYANR